METQVAEPRQDVLMNDSPNQIGLLSYHALGQYEFQKILVVDQSNPNNVRLWLGELEEETADRKSATIECTRTHARIPTTKHVFTEYTSGCRIELHKGEFSVTVRNFAKSLSGLCKDFCVVVGDQAIEEWVKRNPQFAQIVTNMELSL